MANGIPSNAPLSRSELVELWRSERSIVRAWTMAATVVAVAVAAAFVFGDSAAARVTVLGLGLLLLLVIVVLQLRERCPRCNSHLALQSMLVLPDRCRRCGVAFTRPPPLDSELDN